MHELEANDEGADRFWLDVLSAPDVALDVLADLEVLYAGSYHNSHMYERLLADLADPPEIFRIYIVRDREAGDRIVGARAIQSTRHDFVDYRGFVPIHGKRFSVDLAHRQRGLGRRLVNASNSYVFNELDEPVLFGESNEIGALAMHCRAGALVHIRSIIDHFPRNTRAQAVSFFAEFLTNPKLRELRLPTGHGVQFVYCRDKSVAVPFLDDGYASSAQLLAPTGDDDAPAEAFRGRPQ